MKQKSIEYRIEVKVANTELEKLEELQKVLKIIQNNPNLISSSNEREDVIRGINFLSKELELLNKKIYKVADTSTYVGEEVQAAITESEINLKNLKDGAYDVINTLPLELGSFFTAAKKMIFGGLDELNSYTDEGLIKRRENLIELYESLGKELSIEIAKTSQNIENEKEQVHLKRISKQKEIIDEGKRAWVFDIDDAIKQYETEIGELWKFTEEGQELYKNYFAAKKSLYEAEGKDILEVYREQKDFENETTKFYQERERASVEEKYNEDKIILKNQLADGLITREEYAQKQEELTIRYLEDEIALRNSYGKDTTDLEEQLADMRLTIREREEEETAKANAAVADVEKNSQKTRLEQWKDYAEKAAEISQKISEGTKMVTDSLGSMFGQLGSYYADQVQAFTDKINALDEEKEAALERVALSEEERQAKENEIALQKIELEYATSEEQRSKADERIATLQGELSAEDTIIREFGDKKTQLEKEKAKKEKEQKKAEKMEKRLQMSQAIVEAIGNVAAGAAKGLTYGPILGPIMAAIVAAAGAVQVGIMTKQLTKMKDGGLLRGFSHSQGGMRIMGSNVEVEGGEYVVNKQSTSKNLGLLEYINGERRGLGYSDMNTFFEQSSATPSLISQMMNEPSVVPQLPMKDSVDTQILSAIERINFQPRVSVTDINTVHDNMVKVDEWTGL